MTHRRRPRAELTPAAIAMSDASIRLDVEWYATGGSYGRGEPECGDLDVLIVGGAETARAMLIEAGARGIVERPDVVSGYVGDVPVQVWHCRMDQLGPAWLFVQGPARRNLELRARAKRLGWSLTFRDFVDASGPRVMASDGIVGAITAAWAEASREGPCSPAGSAGSGAASGA